MRRLSISLLIVVLLAIVGFGWALDRLFVILQPNVADRLAPYRAMGAAIVSSTYAGADLDAFIATWPEDSSLSISKLNTNAVALPRELLEPFSRGETLELEGDTGVTLMFPLERRDFALTLSIPPATTENESVVRFTLTIVFYTGVILLILLWVYPLVRRLHALSKAANRFGAGDFSSRVPLSRYSLIENIETEFNAMADRIAMLVEDNRLLSNAVSHDLRTPLARLRFGVDALSEEEDPAVQERRNKKALCRYSRWQLHRE